MISLLNRIAVDPSLSSRSHESLRLVQGIFRHEGGLAAFYRGLTPNLLGNSTSWALYFLCYGNIKELMRTWRGGTLGEGLSSADYFLASGSAGKSSLDLDRASVGDSGGFANRHKK